ncbi:hypothetical protein V5O48_010367 [Marasmius crinis-equi]|uniref:Short-chain dehydrogenase n=1 Tax=Marasmius crinis-equi TaxID=585013 RepID=A0ABR3F8U8_9AGAR
MGARKATELIVVTNSRRNSSQECPPAVEGVSLAGQVVVVTGANTGLGFEAAKHFAVRGPEKVIIVCRNEKKGQEALEQRLLRSRQTVGVKTETGFANLELWTADFASFDSVKALKDKIDALDRLDILVENAGIVAAEYETTKDGWESTIQVNVLGPALHVILHLPKLLETVKKYPETTPRIVMVSSDVHYWAAFPVEVVNASKPLETMNLEDHWNAGNRYPESKALDVMFTRALQTHLQNITCCSLNPGFCYSELNRNAKGETAERISKLREKIAFTSEEGSRQLLYSAIGQRDREAEMRGAYISFSRVSECSDFILSEEGQKLQTQVWKEILEVLAKVDERTKGIVGRYLSQ